MTPSDVTTRVTAAACVLGVVLAIPAGWFGGPTVALGVLAGGALAVANFRSLATRAIAVVWVRASPARRGSSAPRSASARSRRRARRCSRSNGRTPSRCWPG